MDLTAAETVALTKLINETQLKSARSALESGPYDVAIDLHVVGSLLVEGPTTTTSRILATKECLAALIDESSISTKRASKILLRAAQRALAAKEDPTVRAGLVALVALVDGVAAELPKESRAGAVRAQLELERIQRGVRRSA